MKHDFVFKLVFKISVYWVDFNIYDITSNFNIFWPSVDISPLIKSRFLGSFDSYLFSSRGNVNILPFHIHPFLYSLMSELSQNIPFIHFFITSTVPLYSEPPSSLTDLFPCFHSYPLLSIPYNLAAVILNVYLKKISQIMSLLNCHPNPLLFFFFLKPYCAACRILVPRPGTEPGFQIQFT